MIKYPAQIDDNTSLPSAIDNVTPVAGSVFNNLRDATIALETELGVQPSGIYSTVRARLDILEGLLNNFQSIQLVQDLGGTPSAPLVIGFQGRPLSSAPPNTGDTFSWNGIAWVPGPPKGVVDVILAGDLSGTKFSQLVVGIQGRPVSPTAPSNGQTLVWVASNNDWEPGTIIGFTAGGDLSGTSTSQTVIKINGATVPVSGSLITGNTLQVSGSSALSYAALNLAGGSNFVTGVLPIGNQASQTLAGDVTGTTAAGTVVKIQNHNVLSQSLGSTQDGYVLTWVNGSTDLEMKISTNSIVQNGGNVWKILSVPVFADIPNTNSSTFVSAATFEFDPTIITVANGTRTMTLRVVAHTTGITMNVQLFNVNTSSIVTGSTLTTTSTTLATLVTGDLSANMSNSLAVYQVQIQMIGGTITDRVTLDFTSFRVTWS